MGNDLIAIGEERGKIAIWERNNDDRRAFVRRVGIFQEKVGGQDQCPIFNSKI